MTQTVLGNTVTREHALKGRWLSLGAYYQGGRVIHLKLYMKNHYFPE